MEEDILQGLNDRAPLVAWIHNISLNQHKYMKKKFAGLDLFHDVRYLMFIYDNPNCSQDDLVNMFCQSKGNVAKVLKKLEDEGFIERKTNPENRRKYMLTVTEKGADLAPKYREISKQWEKEVGITDADEEFKKRLKEIAVNGSRLI